MISFAFATHKPLQGQKHLTPGVQLTQWIMPLWPPPGSTELANPETWEMPLSEAFLREAPTPCCCNLLFTISSKGKHEGCDWASARLWLFQAAGTAPFGAKSKWAQTNHQHRESKGDKPCFSSPGAKPSIYWCFIFYVQFTNQNQLFPQVLCNLLFCKISFTLHFWSVQFHMRAT